MKLPGTTTTPTAAGGLLRRTKGSQGVAVQDVDGMQQWHAAGIKMASDSVVNDGIPVGARALHDAQQAVGQGVGEGGVHVQHTKQGLAHDGQGMGEEDDDMHTPEHALIAAVHTVGCMEWVMEWVLKVYTLHEMKKRINCPPPFLSYGLCPICTGWCCNKWETAPAVCADWYKRACTWFTHCCEGG